MDARAALAAALEPLPTERGGTALIVCTTGPPPAVCLLSTGSVWLGENWVRIGVMAGSSVTQRLGECAVLVVPWQGNVLRAVVTPATCRPAGPVSVIEGRLDSVAPSRELPWSLEMAFVPSGSPGADEFLAYWKRLRDWLSTGAVNDGPHPVLGPD